MGSSHPAHSGGRMIHYHGSPLSGPALGKESFYAGRHALVSFAYRQDLAVISEFCQSFVFDNGAFTVWKRGGVLDVDGYTRWVDDWHRHPGLDWALIPDTIDGDEAENDALLSQWPTHLPGVPVWHMHESLERLRRLATEYRTVALGSSRDFRTPNTALWWARIGKAMTEICDDLGRPMCKLHGLRMLNPAVFSRMPLASADSTNAAVNAGATKRFGMYAPASAASRAAVIADRVEGHQSAPVWADRSNDEGQQLFEFGGELVEAVRTADASKQETKGRA